MIHLIHLIPTLHQLEVLNVRDNKLSFPDATQVEILMQTAKEYSVECNTEKCISYSY